MALGGRELQPEESVNLTLGAVVTLDNGLSLTVDYFGIDIDDRIALSGLFTVTDEIKAALIADGVPEAREFTSVRYFTNDFDTQTRGVDIVLTHGWDWNLGRTDLLISANRTETEVGNFREGSTITSGDTIDNLERGAPGARFNLTATHSMDRWYLVARYSYFGEWYDDHSAAEFDGYGLVDVLARYDFSGGLSVTLGAENALDTYPDEAINYGNGRKYPRYSPAGHNGALVYAKVNYSL